MNAPGAIPAAQERLPFGAAFQQVFAHLLVEDERFCAVVGPHVQPKFFDSEIAQWVWATSVEHRRRHGTSASWIALEEACRKLEPRMRQVYQLGLEQVRASPTADADWVRSQALEWVRRNVFVRAFHDARDTYNRGKFDEAYDLLMREMDKFSELSLDGEQVNETWFFEDLPKRQARRWERQNLHSAIPTGIPQLDHLLGGGLDLGMLGILMAHSKLGKALWDEEPVLVAGGWRRISDLREGDSVIGGSTGSAVRVDGVFPQGLRPCYRVRFTDDTEVIADADHLWSVQTQCTSSLRTTKELSESICAGQGVWVPIAPPMAGPKPVSVLDPYLLGLLIGDGCFRSGTVRFHKPEKDLWEEIRRRIPYGDEVREGSVAEGRCPYISICGKTADANHCVHGHELTPENTHHATSGPRCKECGRRNARESARRKRGCGAALQHAGSRRSRTADELARLGLLGCHSRDKFVPDTFKWADPESRFMLLAGLCDTDGHVIKSGCGIQFSSASKQLAEDVRFLAHSLGGVAAIREKLVKGLSYWVVNFGLVDGRVPVRSVKNLKKARKRGRELHRQIKAVEFIGTRSCTCISVADPKHLFVTRDFVVTHNTTMLINLGRVAARTYRNVAHFFLEGTQEQITNRYDASFSAELYNAVKRGDFGTQKYESLFAEYQFLRRKLYVRGLTDRWNYTVEDIFDVISGLKRQHGWVPDALIVDYADLLRGRGHYSDDLDSNAAAYRDLKTLSQKGRGFAVWTAAQAKKPKEADYDTKPRILKVSDLGGRAEKVRCADFLASLNATLEERTVKGIIRLWVEAVRDNPAGVEIVVPIDAARMLFGAGAGVQVQPASAGATPPGVPQMGYHQTTAGL